MLLFEGVCHKRNRNEKDVSRDPLFVRPFLLRSTAFLSQDDGYPLSPILAKVELMASSQYSAVLHLFERASSLMTVVVLMELLWCELKCSVIPLFASFLYSFLSIVPSRRIFTFLSRMGKMDISKVIRLTYIRF